MSNITYRNLVIDEEQIKQLYLENKWFAYTNHFDNLMAGIRQSMDAIGAYDQDKLVGLLRTVGDGNTIVYIQDILLLPTYQGKGIGTVLMKMILEKYSFVRQILLMTDKNDASANAFYRSLGFVSYEEVDGIGFKYQHK